MEHKKETLNEFSKRHDYVQNVVLKIDTEQDDHHIQKELKAGSSTEEIMKHKLKKLEQRVDQMTDQFLSLLEKYDSNLKEVIAWFMR